MIIERGTDALISITQRNLRLVQQEWLKIKYVGSIGGMNYISFYLSQRILLTELVLFLH